MLGEMYESWAFGEGLQPLGMLRDGQKQSR